MRFRTELKNPYTGNIIVVEEDDIRLIIRTRLGDKDQLDENKCVHLQGLIEIDALIAMLQQAKSLGQFSKKLNWFNPD